MTKIHLSAKVEAMMKSPESADLRCNLRYHLTKVLDICDELNVNPDIVNSIEVLVNSIISQD